MSQFDLLTNRGSLAKDVHQCHLCRTVRPEKHLKVIGTITSSTTPPKEQSVYACRDEDAAWCANQRGVDHG